MKTQKAPNCPDRQCHGKRFPRSQSPTPFRFAQGRPGRQAAFTLVELLVVIAIIAVMASIAIFSTRGAREKAMRVKAISSLRQVAAASVAFSSENNGDINTMRWGGDPKEGGGSTWVSNTFWGRLQPYLFSDISLNNQSKLKNELTLRLNELFSSTNCHTMAGTFINGSGIYHDTSGLPVPLGFNTNLNKWGRFVKMASIDDPSQTIYATYGYAFISEADGQTYVPIPTDNKAPKSHIHYFTNKTAAAYFLDGHMEMISPPIPQRRFK